MENVSACRFSPTDHGSIIMYLQYFEMSSYGLLARHASSWTTQERKINTVGYMVYATDEIIIIIIIIHLYSAKYHLMCSNAQSLI